MVEADETYTLSFRAEGFGSEYFHKSRHVYIDLSEVASRAFQGTRGDCWREMHPVMGDAGSYMAHELLGHGTDASWRKGVLGDWFTWAREAHAMGVENEYLKATDQAKRCIY
jgi:hypothetical protein